VSRTQWALGPSSRQPVCPDLTPDAEINTSYNIIVSCFPQLSRAIPEGGISWAFRQLRGLEGLKEAVPRIGQAAVLKGHGGSWVCREESRGTAVA
jgi:hypothetical protein